MTAACSARLYAVVSGRCLVRSAGRQREARRRWGSRLRGYHRRGHDRSVGAGIRRVHVSEGQHDQHQDHTGQERAESPQGGHDRSTAGTGIVRRPPATPPRRGPVGEADGRLHVASTRTSPARMPPHSLEPHDRSMTRHSGTLARFEQTVMSRWGGGRQVDRRPARRGR